MLVQKNRKLSFIIPRLVDEMKFQLSTTTQIRRS